MKIVATELDLVHGTAGPGVYFNIVGGYPSDSLDRIGAVALVSGDSEASFMMGSPRLVELLVLSHSVCQMLDFDKAFDDASDEKAVASTLIKTINLGYDYSSSDKINGKGKSRKLSNADISALAGVAMAYYAANGGAVSASGNSGKQRESAFRSSEYVEAARRLFQTWEGKAYGASRFRVHGRRPGECVALYPADEKADAVLLAKAASGEYRTIAARCVEKGSMMFFDDGSLSREKLISKIAEHYGITDQEQIERDITLKLLGE